MAYEIFDDIAFFYLAMSCIAMAVLPWSCLKLGFFLWESVQKPQLIPLTRIQKLKLAQAKINGTSATTSNTLTVQPAAGTGEVGTSTPHSSAASAAAASGLTQESLKPAKPWITCGNITLFILWILFIWMIFQIPSFRSENLASFKPYDILGIEPKATDDQIKKVTTHKQANQSSSRN